MKTINPRWICFLLMYMLSGFMSHQVAGKIIRKETIDLIPPEGWIGGTGNTSKSRIVQLAISASINGSLLHIQSTSPTVDVTICIIQDGLIVYHETVPATETEHIWINLSNYIEGIYTLDLTNSEGGHVYGEFDL